MVRRVRFCRCHTCKEWYDALGIASHRAMHRRKKEKCTITYSNGDTYDHNFDRIRLKEEERNYD